MSDETKEYLRQLMSLNKQFGVTLEESCGYIGISAKDWSTWCYGIDGECARLDDEPFVYRLERSKQNFMEG